jgi:hypothetical protein
MINLSNYETWFLQYADGECSPAERLAVEQFLQLHPSLQEELSGLMEMHLEPEEISMPGKDFLRFTELEKLNEQFRFEPDLQIHFPDKSLLYRKQGSRILYLYRSVAAAAVLLISFGLYQLQSSDPVQQMVVTKAPAAESIITPAPENIVVNTGDQKGSRIALVAKAEPIEKPQIIVTDIVQESEAKAEVSEDAVVQAEVIMPVQEENKSQSNLSEEVLKAAASRMETTAIAIPASASLNTAVLINDATKPNDKKPLRSLVRILTRRILHDNEANEEGQFIQVANFHIHVKN